MRQKNTEFRHIPWHYLTENKGKKIKEKRVSFCFQMPTSKKVTFYSDTEKKLRIPEPRVTLNLTFSFL